MTQGWFSVDPDGLRKLIDNRGKSFALYELVQNAWDTDADNVSVTLEKIPGKPWAKLVVTDDDPNGFHDLAHAYTLFAESKKKTDPTKRGRFNLGEKLVLALCKEAEVRSTKGTVTFHADGTMTKGRSKTNVGSVFSATIRMTNDEYAEVCADIHKLIVPTGVFTTFNGSELPSWEEHEIACFTTTLPTLKSNEEGVLTRTKRKTTVEVYEADGPAWVYEMGIPVVETGDKYHVNVHQKVPLNMDRDNVPPGYLRKLRAEVLNRTATMLSEDEASESWVTNALESDDVEADAVESTLDKRFGEKRAIYDPSDPEANKQLVSQGFTVISGGSLPSGAWANVRRHGAAQPSGRIAPTPKPFSDNPNDPVMKSIDPDDWTPGMREVADILRWFAEKLEITDNLHVSYYLPGISQRHWGAAWGEGIYKRFSWNVHAMGKKWFDNWAEHPEALIDYMTHEFAHHWASDHLDEAFHKACTKLSGKIAFLIYLYDNRIPHWETLESYRNDLTVTVV